MVVTELGPWPCGYTFIVLSPGPMPAALFVCICRQLVLCDLCLSVGFWREICAERLVPVCTIKHR